MSRLHFFNQAEDFREPYHYTACGLDNIYLLNGYEFEEHDGEHHVFVRDSDDLHKVIGLHIVTKRKGLTGPEIRFLRNTLDLTQDELAKDLGNNAQSIARWEKGKYEIPGHAEKLLRVYFFAKLASDDELRALRDLILQKLSELDEVDDTSDERVNFVLNKRWTEKAPQYACC